jgi:uncharacterized membrane protein
MRFHLALVALVVGLAAPAASFAQDSAQNGSNAVKASAQAVGDLGVSGVQTVSAVAVLPISVAGGGSVVAGESLTATGSDAIEAAGDSADFASKPLPVTKKVVVAQPAPKVSYDAQQPTGKP